jgi:hypothetical protein
MDKRIKKRKILHHYTFTLSVAKQKNMLYLQIEKNHIYERFYLKEIQGITYSI